MRRFLQLAAPVVAIPMIIGQVGSAPAQETFRLKMQTAVPSGSPHMELLTRFADNVKAMSGERLTFEILPDGAVVGAQQIADAVDKGLVDAGFAWTHYWTGKNPAAGLFSAPLSGAGTGLDQMGHLAWMLQGEGGELYRQLYQEVIGLNVVPFQVIPDGPEALGWFKQPVTSVEQFKGIKFRAPPGLPGQAYTAMGIPVTSMPGSEILPAAERGVIDAAEWINPAADLNLGLYDVFSHYSLQGLHQAIDIGDLIINKSVFDRMPADLQAIVEVAAKASLTEALTYFIAENAKALETLKSEHNVTLFDAPADYPEQYLAAANQVIDDAAAQDAFFKQVVDSMRSFATDAVPYRAETLKQSLFMGEAGMKVRGGAQ